MHSGKHINNLKYYIMTKFFLGISLIYSVFFFAQNGNVGINTASPSAALDIVSGGNTSATKALEINNSSALEMLTVQNDGNVGINSSTTANNTAQLNVNSGSAAKPVLKINNLSNTKDRTASALNYNQFSDLVADNNGNVFLQYDIRTVHSSALTFDGIYNASTSYTNFVEIGVASVVQFQLLSDFVFGDTANGGSVLYADITYSRDGGFQVSTYGSSSVNANTLTITGIGTNTLTFDYGTGRDLVFYSPLPPTGGGTPGFLQYKVSSGSNVPFTVFNSYRTRS